MAALSNYAFEVALFTDLAHNSRVLNVFKDIETAFFCVLSVRILEVLNNISGRPDGPRLTVCIDYWHFSMKMEEKMHLSNILPV